MTESLTLVTPFNYISVMKHGGKRKGSGRKKKYPTKVVRIPKAIEDEVNELKLGYEILWDGKQKTFHIMP